MADIVGRLKLSPVVKVCAREYIESNKLNVLKIN